jgi:hypothetical protein
MPAFSSPPQRGSSSGLNAVGIRAAMGASL